MGRPKSWASMPPSKRAKQFAMFDALSDLKEAIKAKEYRTEPRRYLAEDAAAELNHTLSLLEKGCIATVVFYHDATERYTQLTARITKMDCYFSTLHIGDTVIDISDIIEVFPVLDSSWLATLYLDVSISVPCRG